MIHPEPSWDHHVPLPKLGPLYSRLLVALVSLICFINSYDGDFVFDDSEAILNNKDLNPDTPLSNIWKNDFWGSNLSSNSSHKSYRPLTVLTFLNYLLAGGLYPVGFHVLNIGLHCVISALMIDVFATLIGGLACDGTAKRLGHVPKASLLAALFFAAHPVHTESVAGIVGRADLLCALFFQLSFLSYCRAFQGDKSDKFSVSWIVVSLLLCAVAMLCKEQGITVLGVNGVFDILVICNLDIYELTHKLLVRRKTADCLKVGVWISRGLIIRLALLLFCGSLLLYARWRIMGTGPPAFTEVDNPASFAENVFLRIVNYNYYYSLNAWLLLCPWWLCFDWSMGCVPLIKSAGDWRIVWLLLLWACLIGLIKQALCSPDSSKRTLTFGLVLLVIPFLPASNLFFRVGFVIAERVLYLSTAGYCLVLAYAGAHCCCRWRKHKKLLQAAMLALLGMNVVRCAHRSQQWTSEQSLFTSALSVCPLNAKVHYNVGKNLADHGNQSAAIKYYREAVNLAQAELIGKEALKILPKDHTIMFSLANVLGKQQKYKESEGFFLNALKINPNAASCHGNLVLYHRWGKLDLAKKHYELSLKLDPKAPGTNENYNMLKRKLEQRQRTAG
uniref:dolichyl-phosphate-mannose--protein mannosyltransferase n=1 Tax=Astyanax mexicanus TaxID=7994 RepID=W5K457_ASTMX